MREYGLGMRLMASLVSVCVREREREKERLIERRQRAAIFDALLFRVYCGGGHERVDFDKGKGLSSTDMIEKHHERTKRQPTSLARSFLPSLLGCGMKDILWHPSKSKTRSRIGYFVPNFTCVALTLRLAGHENIADGSGDMWVHVVIAGLGEPGCHQLAKSHSSG